MKYKSKHNEFRKDRPSRDVRAVVCKDLCVGCGTCYSACPEAAITLGRNDVFKPIINVEKCSNCGLCEFVCPGYHVDYRLFEARLSSEDRHSPLIGRYVDLYLANAKDRYSHVMGSSGGVATAILSYALERQIIDGALVVTSRKLNPEVMIAKSSAELEQAMGSKYLPVPLNVGLRSILHSEGRFAVVGLPCHLMGLNRMTIAYPILARKITLRLGLFCGRGFDFHYINFFLKGLGLSPSRTLNVRFRTHGWPGKVFINYSSEVGEKELLLDHSNFSKYSGSYLFMPKRCIFCPDHTAELADISIGDASIHEIRRLGLKHKSIIIARTALGEKITRNAAQVGFINVSRFSPEGVIRAQNLQLNFHKIAFRTRWLIARFLGISTPLVNVELTEGEFLPMYMGVFSVSLVMTQVIYRFLKKLGVSESLPKFLVRLWAIFHYLVGSVVYNSRVRD